MALVLREKTNRKGETKRFDVVRAHDDTAQALDSINEGSYKVLEGSTIKSVNVSYRVVQDLDWE